MQIEYIIFVLSMLVYFLGAIFCGWALIEDDDAEITPLVFVISFLPILHWYIVFKKYHGGMRKWVDELKKNLKK